MAKETDVELKPHTQPSTDDVQVTVEDADDDELMTEVGATGTIITHGILSNVDYNHKLTGTQRIQVYDEMRLGDGTVRQALLVVKLPVMSASWFVKPASDETKDEEIKKFVYQQLMKNENFSWNVLLRQILTFCENGNSIFEKVFEVIKDGEYKGKVGWKGINQRLVKTIYRWTLEDGKTPGVVQQLPAGKTTDDGKSVTKVDIPAWKLFYFILEQEGSNFEGISLLRSAYKHWYMKETYYKIDAIATERQGLGIPIVTSPPNARPEDKRKAREIAKNLRTNSQAYADLPQGFTLTMMDMKAQTVRDPEKMIMHHDRQIMKSVLGAFFELGSQGSSGSYSLGETMAEFFYLSVQYIAKLVQEELQKGIKELVDLNYGKQESYPSLEFGWIGKIDLKALSSALKEMIDSDVVIPDIELERHVREAFHLPKATYMEVKDGEEVVDPREEMRKQEAEIAKAKVVSPFGNQQVDEKGNPVKPKPNEAPVKKLPTLKATEDNVLQSFADDAKDLLEQIDQTINAKEST